jgi:ribosome-binding ATPase
MDSTIIGLAHCGKTTLLEALAGAEVSGTGTATVRVRDVRIDALTAIFKPKKTVYGEIRVREAAWPGAGEGQRKSDIERYLNTIRGSRLFLHVVAAAQTPMMSDPPDPAGDLAKLDSEMIFADLLSIERVLERARKAPMEENVKQLLLRLKAVLEQDRLLFTEHIDEAEKAMVAGFNLITLTPQLIVVNTGEDFTGEFDASVFGARLAGRHVLSMCFPLAREVSMLPREEQDAFAREMGMAGPAAESVSREVFRQLDLISFFTVGEDECRAWPIKSGTSARAAAGEIHSDIERGFIRAEVVGYDEFMKRKSLKICKDEGILRLEGKEYIIRDGEIVHYRFNV